VLGRLIEPLSEHLERRDRAAAVLHVRLQLVTRVVHERSLQLPAPIRDARTLRTLALLDLESHPPAAAIDRVVVAVDPTPGRVVQFSLLTRPLPSPEQVSTLMARLAALMGEDRCGSPAVVDSWQPGAFGMKPFAPAEPNIVHKPQVSGRPGLAVQTRRSAGPQGRTRPTTEPIGRSRPMENEPQRHGDTEPLSCSNTNELRVSVPPWPVAVKDAAPAIALRRFRCPVAARVRVDDGKPARMTIDRRGLGGGHVEACAGPWRTSGAWWIEGGAGPWDRDEWDVTLSDGATYRIFRERNTDHWFVDGVVD
jgi:protein ImuB